MGIRDQGTIKWFREFRWSRPFWGALFVGAGGVIIGALPLIGPINDLIRVGYGTFVTELVALGLLAMAGLILFFPTQRMIAAVVAVLISLASFPLTNLGGFVVGMMAGIIGGSLAFGWVPDKKQWKRGEAPPPDDGPRPPRGQPGAHAETATDVPDNYTAVKESVFVGGRA
jgi:hypothetical protein